MSLHSYPRALTPAELAALPERLKPLTQLNALLIPEAHPIAKLMEILGLGKVIMVRSTRIFWPQLPDDLAVNPADLALLAHELVHVWQYHTGMTLWRYIWRERGIYAYKLLPCKPFRDYGYEQQAALVEDYVRLSHGLKARHALEWVRLDDLEDILPDFI